MHSRQHRSHTPIDIIDFVKSGTRRKHHQRTSQHPLVTAVMAAQKLQPLSTSMLSSFTTRACCMELTSAREDYTMLTTHRPPLRPPRPRLFVYYPHDRLPPIPHLLHHPPNPQLATTQIRRVLQIPQRAPARRDRWQHTRHHSRLGRLRLAPTRPRPPHLRLSAQNCRCHPSTTFTGAEIPTLPPREREYWGVHQWQ